MLNIIEDFVTPDRYGIKCHNYMIPIGITVHNTANDACAANEINYMKNNNYESSFHFAVDDIEIRQAIPLNRNAWHASDGNGPGNMKTIAIEICYSKSGGERFNRAEENAAQLIAFLCKSYDWNINCVKRHYDYDTKNHKYCPHRTMDYGWNRYLDIVKDYMDDSKIEVNIREGGADITRERLKYEINRAYLTLE